MTHRTEHPAGAFKARGTPAVMRLHEIMGIEQNRQWGVCSLNDFRKVCRFACESVSRADYLCNSSFLA